jgi:(R,R)-butanediol dehydrogenase/meso-butanediol dehydrogenase/diacetyl reductase
MMATMKAVRYLGREDVHCETVDIPRIGQEEALIKVAYGGICGSDMFIYSGEHPRAKAPLVLGHEFSGTVAELPNGYGGDFAVGDSVVVNPLISCGQCTPCRSGHAHVCKTLRLTGIDTDGGFAEYARVPLDQLVRLPAGISLEHGAIVEPVAVAVHAVRRSMLKAGDRVLVIGGGPIGYLVAAVARIAGAGRVMVVEPNDFRRKLVSGLGVETMAAADADRILARTGGDGADVVFEVAGVAAAMEAAVACCKIRGQIVNVSVFHKPAPVNLLRVNFAELTIIGIRVYTREAFDAAAAMVAAHPELARVITHRLPFEEAKRGIELMRRGGDNLKVLLHP